MPDNDRMLCGRGLESAIADLIAKKYNLEHKKADGYWRIPGRRLGTSLDYTARKRVDTETWGIFEIKNVDSWQYKEKWIDGQPPRHIYCQVQHQMLVAGYQEAFIGVLAGGNEPHLVRIERNEEFISEILKRSEDLWRRVCENDPPAQQQGKDDWVYQQFAEPGKVIGAAGDAVELVKKYRQWNTVASRANRKKAELKGRILALMDDAETMHGPDFTVSAGMVGPKMIDSHERKGYRSFKITKRKVK
jgi:predicted phage-related endonuclease